jgi:hypothetical protein
MLTYSPQFCKTFSASAPPAWQGPWAAWRPWSGPCEGGGPLAHAPGRSVPASMPVPPPLHATWTAPTPHPTLRTWWTPQAVNVCHVHGPHTTPSARHTRHSGGVSRCPSLLQRACDGAEGLRAWARVCTYGRNPRVPTGEVPCTYGRSPCVPTGEMPCTYGRRNMR